VRLQKYLASCGLGSRRSCEDLITAGRVSVDGETVDKQGVVIDPAAVKVCLDGKPVQSQKNVYVLFNKPRDVITTCSDPQGRRTFADFIPNIGVRLYHVGRLDRDSEGALILTNDGELADALMHPRRQVDKTYVVWTSSNLSGDQTQRMKRGVRSKGQLLRCERVELVKDRQYRVVVRQGRKREIRRLFERFDIKVLRLKRIAIGSLGLGRLRSGGWRYLTDKEVESLWRGARAGS
jgi:23S rRNA pseudouridine2605 synthase